MSGLEYAKYLADVLRAEAAGEDLQEDASGIIVCAKREDGTLYELGRVSAVACYQDPDGARLAIRAIKYGRRQS